jgi:hypothetical protein
MTPAPYASPDLLRDIDRWQRNAFAAGGLFLAASVAGAFFWPAQFFRSYLMGYLFCLGAALGSLALVMLQHLTGGAWGALTRKSLEAAARTLPALALFFLPILAGMPYLYDWSHPELVQQDEILRHRAGYLNPASFTLRAAVYFTVWIVLQQLLTRWSAEQDEGFDRTGRFEKLSAPGLILYVFSVTFASVDWAESLENHWYSTIWGFLFVAQHGLTATCLAILSTTLLSRGEPLHSRVTARHFQDQGKLLLMFVMVWAYFSYAQLLIVWSGNLPPEISWYLPRVGTSWGWVGGSLIVFQFIVPFLLLLFRQVKRRPVLLSSVVALLLLMRFVDLFWIIAPKFYETGFHLDWLNIVTPLSLVCLWTGAFLRLLKTRPLLPAGMPDLQEVLNYGGH